MRLNKHHFHKYQQHFHFLTLSSGNLLISVAILTCLIANEVTKTNAVPTDSTDGTARTQLLQRALRDVAAIAASFMQDDVTKDATSVAAPAIAALTSDEASSSVQPQGQCLLDGSLVAETSVYCKKKVGCRAIQKTGHCCPDYKCDCEKDGKTYLNGDKLVDPETPCTVCYCQGGDILCSPVSCFHRDDCTPKYVAGRCCPEYDNCPVSSPEPNTTTNKTINDALSLPTTPKPEVPAAALNPKITIKEITKPTEIRITDDNKAIPIHQMLKPSTTEPTTTTTTTTSTTTTTLASATALAAIETSDVSTTKATSTHESFGSDTNHITNNNYKPAGGINNESLKLSASVAYSSTEHSHHAMASNGIAQQMHEIVMVDNRNGGEKPFAAFGTQGLQRVESEGANDPNQKVNIKREFPDTTDGAPTISTSDITSEEYASSELIFAEAPGTTKGHAANFLHSSAEATEPDTAGSDNIYHIIVTTEGPRVGSSTENYLALKGSIATEGYPSSFEANTKANFNSIQISAEQQIFSSTESPQNEATSTNKPLDMSTEGIETSTALSSTSTPKHHSPLKPSTEGPQHLLYHHLSEDEDTAIPIEANPAYPSLPEDDFSLRDVNFPLSEGDELVDEPRSIGGGSSYDALKSTKQLDDAFINMSGSGSGDNGVVMEPSTESSGEPMSASSIIAIMYSAEDISEETAVLNVTDFRLIGTVKESENETGSGESKEMDSVELYMGSGSGGGSSELNSDTKAFQKREPTTPRPTKRPFEVLDIDDIGTFNETISPAEDPKLDVESLKLDEDQNESNSNSDAAIKGNILSTKTHPLQDRTIEDQFGAVGVAGEQLGGERVQRLFLQRVY